jgi:predicted ATPase
MICVRPWAQPARLYVAPSRQAQACASLLGIRSPPVIVTAGLGTGVWPAAEEVARVLARQQLLLVLDNCEHLIGVAAELCARLLTACDDVRILVTSREPLAVAGEAR